MLKIKFFKLLFLLFVFTLLKFNAQSKFNFDSAKAVYFTTNDLKIKLKTASLIIIKYKNDIDSSVKYFNLSETEFKKKDYIFGVAYVNNKIGYVYRESYIFDKSINHFNKSINLFQTIKNDTMVAEVCLNLGFIYYSKGDYEKSIETYLLGINKIKNSNNKTTLAWLYNQTGLSFCNKPNPDYRLALEYYMRALEIHKRYNFIEKSGMLQLRIGSVYARLKNDSKALHYFNEALKLAETTKNLTLKLWTQVAFAKFYIDHQQYQKAIDLEKNCLTLFQLDKDFPGVIDSYKNLANCYHKLNNNKLALNLIDSAIYYSITNNIYEKFDKIYALKSDIHKALGQYDLAFDYFKKSVHVKDSIFSEMNSKNINELQTKYNTEGKEQEIKLLNIEKASDKKIKKLFINAFILTFLFILSIVYVLVKINKAKKQLSIQKKEIEFQKSLIEVKHKEITDSINYAKRIQHSLLASNQFLTQYLKNYFILFKPKDVVSGDFYWATKLNNNNFALMCADSTGHGVPGAIMSLLNISCLEKAIEVEKLVLPHEILNYTRLKIINTLKKDGSIDGGKDGMDGTLICIDFENLVLTCACALNPIWIIRNKSIIEIKADRFPIGKHERDNESFTLHTMQLQKNDLIYTFTDGFQDQFGGPKSKKFKYKKLQELILSIESQSLNTQKEILNKAFEDWKGSLEQVDDVCVIGLRV